MIFQNFTLLKFVMHSMYSVKIWLISDGKNQQTQGDQLIFAQTLCFSRPL